MSLYTRQISKTLKSDNTHGGAGKEFSYTTGRYIHWYDHFGKILKIGIFYATAIILVAIHEHGKMFITALFTMTQRKKVTQNSIN